MEHDKDHITVCICTFKRQHLLKNLLHRLQRQVTENLFTFSITIVDNDGAESAKEIVSSCNDISDINISYACEPEQNIALARNKAIDNSKGDFVAFLDDDEFPVDHWLLALYKACRQWRVDGVLGPVLPYYETTPPNWVVRGKLFDRPSHGTGAVLGWENTRTGNVLIRRSIFNDKANRFNKDFLTSEDREFFRRMIERGHVFMWCNDAPVYEFVPPERWKRSFMLRRALFRGKISLNYPGTGPADILKSIAAVFLYVSSMPILLFMGQGIFMRYLIKVFDHLGKILAFCGIDLVRQKYVTE